MNVVSCDEHIPESERCIHMMKEHTRGAYSTLPFRIMLLQVIIKLFYWDIFWINIFPEDAGICKSVSPRPIITGLEV